jgi:hypothetical protein
VSFIKARSSRTDPLDYSGQVFVDTTSELYNIILGALCKEFTAIMKRANSMVGVMSWMRLTKMLIVFYAFFSSITPGVESQPSPVQEVSTNTAANDSTTTNQEM